MKFSIVFRLTMLLLLTFFHLNLTTTTVAQETTHYFSDFESNDGGLIGTGSWQWGLPSAGPDTAFSDFLCWGTNLTGNYDDLADFYLETPPIDLTNATFPALSFTQWFQFEGYSSYPFIVDGGNVKISVDGGPFEILEPFWGYDGIVQVEENVLHQEPVFSGFENGNFWHLRQFSLERFAGSTIVIRFHVGSDANVNFPGWYIDDLSVKESTRFDAAVFSIDSPVDRQIDQNLSLSPQATVYNAGFGSQSFDVEMSIELNGVEDYQARQTVNNLASNQKAGLTFAPWPPSGTGSFKVILQTFLPNDFEAVNDTMTISANVVDPMFSDVTSIAGLVGSERTGSWGDYDNDGYEDLFSNGNLFHNLGDGTFEIVPAGLPAASTSSWADFDNDGLLDLGVKVSGSERFPRLYKNLGQGVFSEVTEQAGLLDTTVFSPSSASWADYNHDGFVDWYFGTRHFHNNGDGTFSDSAQTIGTQTDGAQTHAWCDYDNDGDLDVYVGFSASRTNRLFNNDGNGHFTDVALIAGVLETGSSSSLGAEWGDYDNDGFFDLFVARADEKPDRLFHNNGDGTFTEIATDLGIANNLFSSGVRWMDYDLDGDLDIFVSGRPVENLQLFLNNSDGSFVTPSRMLFLPSSSRRLSRPSAADYDNDGDVDLFLLGKLYRNNNSNNNNWLQVKTTGTTSNKAGIGARVRIVSNSFSQMRQVTGGTGHSQNSLPVEFGLGSHGVVDSLFVRWPSGNIDTLTNVKSNQMVTIMEGNGIVSEIKDKDMEPTIPLKFVLEQNYPNPFNPETKIQFQLPKTIHVVITIFNILGQEIRMLTDAPYEAGFHTVRWDGKDKYGNAVSSGIYLFHLQAGDFAQVKKMSLLH